MANVYGGTPPIWVIDTASATAITTDPTKIFRIRWVAGGSAVAGNECKITTNDATPLVIFDEFATGADYETIDMTLPKDTIANGIIVPTLAAGKVYLYLA